MYLTQGLLFGVGTSLAFYPVVVAPSQWFDQYRGLATGLAVSGSGLGGMAMAPITRWLIDATCVAWTLRCLAAGICVALLIAIGIIRSPPPIFLENRLELGIDSGLDKSAAGKPSPPDPGTCERLECDPKTSKPPQREETDEEEARVGSWRWFLARVKHPAFIGFWFTNIFASLGYLVPFYYMPGKGASEPAS